MKLKVYKFILGFSLDQEICNLTKQKFTKYKKESLDQTAQIALTVQILHKHVFQLEPLNNLLK